jgi:ribosomal protein L24
MSKAYKKKIQQKKAQTQFHVKKGDSVYVLSGDHKGTTAVISQVNRATNRVILSGITFPSGKVKYIHVSNVALAKAE